MAATRRSRARKAPAAKSPTTTTKKTTGAGSQKASGKLTIHAPNRRFSGVRAGVVFKDGTATIDAKEDASALAYFTRQGYGIGEKPEPAAKPERPVDAREVADSQVVGTPLRDAAVDPKASDFLAPVNAGEGDPHGPTVVSPEIHHDGPAGLKPGDVHVDDPDEQERDEKELAEAILIEGQPKGIAVAKAAGGGEMPARSASQKAWAAWAVSQGADPTEADSTTRAELIERFGGEG